MLVKQSQLRMVPEMRDWQTQAWDLYDRVGELRFAAQWISNALSRCRLYVGMPDEDGGRPDPIGEDEASAADFRARIPLDELFGGPSGHPGMLSSLGIHLTVPGESYLIAFDDTESGERRWMIASSEEFTKSGETIKVRLPESDRLVPIKLNESTVIRLWRPHPRRGWEADSPVRAALPILRELVDLSAHIAATIESRLAGAGLLLLPESATLPTPLTQQGEPLHEDPAMATLIDAMVTPIGDRDSAAAVVPIIVRIPDSATGKPQWMTFSTPLDQKIQELREASIRRFATVVDIPAEVMSGAASSTGGNVSHWGMWKIEESAIKLHVEPLLSLICDALTTQYLWPALAAMGVANSEDYVIWYDVSELVLRPNRGPESLNLYDQTLVKGATTRRANGFNEDDAPDEEELRRHLLTSLATKGIDPVLVQPYLAALGIELDIPEPVAAQVDPNAPPGTRTMGRPSTPDVRVTRPDALPQNAPPGVAASAGSVVPMDFAAVCEFGAVRALELVGKRLLNNSNREWRGRLRGIDPWEIHTQIQADNVEELLDGAYSVLTKCLPDQPCAAAVIDGYVRERLVGQLAHDRRQLLSLLAQAGCVTAGGVSRGIA